MMARASKPLKETLDSLQQQQQQLKERLPAVGGREAEVISLFLDLGCVPSQGVTLLL